MGKDEIKGVREEITRGNLTHSYPAAGHKTDFVNIFFLLFRDVSFLYDMKYVKGEARERALCPPHLGHSLQSRDGVIVPHKVNKAFDK